MSSGVVMFASGSGMSDSENCNNLRIFWSSCSRSRCSSSSSFGSETGLAPPRICTNTCGFSCFIAEHLMVQLEINNPSLLVYLNKHLKWSSCLQAIKRILCLFSALALLLLDKDNKKRNVLPTSTSVFLVGFRPFFLSPAPVFFVPLPDKWCGG